MIIFILLLILTKLQLILFSAQGIGVDKLLSTERVKGARGKTKVKRRLVLRTRNDQLHKQPMPILWLSLNSHDDECNFSSSCSTGLWLVSNCREYCWLEDYIITNMNHFGLEEFY